jgi:hypothetical protein
MKKNQMTIGDFLARYESDASFSNVGGQPSFPGDLSFEGAYGDTGGQDLTFSGAAGGPMSGNYTESKPYVIQIVNATAGTLNAILFGWTDNDNAVNFGSPAGITISVLPAGTVAGYQRLLSQSATKPFSIVKWVLSSTNTAQVTLPWNAVYWDANQRQCSDPITMPPDPNQFSNTSYELIYRLKIDGDTQLSIPILANTTFIIFAYPDVIGDLSRPQIGGPTDKTFTIPQTSGRGNRVVIQTSPNARTQMGSI